MNKRATDDVINGTQSRTNFIIIGYREVIAKSGEQMVVRRYSLSECSVITDIFYASLFKIVVSPYVSTHLWPTINNDFDSNYRSARFIYFTNRGERRIIYAKNTIQKVKLSLASLSTLSNHGDIHSY